LPGDDQAGLAVGWRDVIELVRLSAGWTQSSRAAPWLAGDDRAKLAFGWLDAIEPNRLEVIDDIIAIQLGWQCCHQEPSTVQLE